jgi:hypothetical protein
MPKKSKIDILKNMTKNNAFLYEFFIVSEGFLLLEFKNENTHFYGKNIIGVR